MLSPSLIQELQTELQGVTVLTPGADGYEASLKRWSETAEKRAVSTPINLSYNLSVAHSHPNQLTHPPFVKADTYML